MGLYRDRAQAQHGGVADFASGAAGVGAVPSAIAAVAIAVCGCRNLSVQRSPMTLVLGSTLLDGGRGMGMREVRGCLHRARDWLAVRQRGHFASGHGCADQAPQD